MTEAPKKRRGRPAKKKKEETKEAPAFLEEPKEKVKRDHSRPTTAQLKAPCIHCGKTSLVTKKTSEPIQVCHRVNGKTYNTLIRRLAICKNCGKHNSINNYEIR